MKCGKQKLAFFCLLFFAGALFAQVAELSLEEQSLSLSQQAHKAVQELRLQSSLLSQQVTDLLNNSKISESERDYYKTLSTDLNQSLTNTIDSLGSTSEKLIASEANLKRMTKIAWIMGIIFGIGILLRIVGVILWAKGIKLPYLLNLIM
jgi:hypothetical protein